MINTTCASFPKLLAQSLSHLNPSGWLEMQDCYLPVQSDDGMIGKAFGRWNELFEEAVLKIGRDTKEPAKSKGWMEEAVGEIFLTWVLEFVIRDEQC